jgi:tetratricopeptide (TPR) repeat protein
MFTQKMTKPVLIIVGVLIGLAVIARIVPSNNPKLLLTKGQEHLNVDEFDQAFKFCDRVTLKKSEEIEGWLCKAESALFLGKTEEAKNAYDQILELDPENINAILGIGDTLIQSGQLQQAGEQYYKLLKNDSKEEVEKFLNLIKETGKFAPVRLGFIEIGNEESLKIFEELTGKEPYSNLPVVWWGRGLALFAQDTKNSASALVSFDKAIEISQEEFYPALVSKGIALLEEKELSQALNICEQAIEINPNYIEAKLCQAQAFFELNRYDKALASTENIITTNPEDYGAWILKGLIHAKLKQYDQAFEANKKAIAINPNDSLGYSNQADTLYYQKNYEEALKFADQSIEISRKNNLPISNDTWFIRGNVLTDLEQYREAASSYYEAVKIKEDFPAAWNAFAKVLEKVELYDEAIEGYKKAIEFDPKYYYAWEGLGNIFLKQGKNNQAVEAYDQVISIVQELPQDVRIGYPLHGVWNSKGKALLAEDEFGKAIDSFTKALEIKPDFASAAFNLGQTSLKLHLYENAITAFDLAIKSDPNLQTAQTEKAKAQELLNNAPFLGIIMQNTDDSEGVLVKQVEPNSPAEREGIKVGDVIAEIDEVAVSNISQTQLLIRSGRIGSLMTIKIVRNGSTEYFKVKREKRS